MKIRVISLFLAALLLLSLVPVPLETAAAATTAEEIEQQIRSAYNRSLSASGREDFDGYCGTLVSWQLFCLGIDRRVYINDGKRQFDAYNAMEMTSGGYKVKSYPASRYTLREALNTITANGTVDAYNMVVGFEKTNTAAGSIYGHALVIHAILDGVVYFVECYDASIAGRYWAEGQPISCTIDAFCNYYDRWTVFDGVAYFGLKSYADACKEYSASFQAMVTENAQVCKEPGDPGYYDPECYASVIAGQWLQVTGLYRTPKGKYWYRVDFGDRTGFVEAEKLVMDRICYTDIQIGDLRVPTNLHKGYSFVVRGNVTAEISQVDSVTVVIATEEGQPLHTGTATPKNGKLSLNTASINNNLPFRRLAAGTYYLTVEAAVTNHILENGEVTARTQTVQLHRSQFRVVSDWSKYYTVSFHGNGGSALTDQTAIQKGTALGELPTAQRSGYAFQGWSLDPAGNSIVSAQTVITANTTLYAQWTEGHTGSGGWQQTEKGNHYCDGYQVTEGWIEYQGLSFYQYADGTLATGWVMIDGCLRFFNAAGVLATELQCEDGRVFCLNSGGLLGWTVKTEE